MFKDFPKAHEVDRTRFETDRQNALPRQTYVMMFTPRSGSSWLTDVAKRTGRLGHAGECFNPNFMPEMTRALAATDLPEYADVLSKRRATKGVHGFQITHHQLIAVFDDEETFKAYFPDPKVFWLIRRDIVSQAVSLFKMQATQITHAAEMAEGEIERREPDFHYDGKQIRRWLRHILAAELATETMLAKFGWTPFRLWYEWNTAIGAEATADAMFSHLGLGRIPGDVSWASKHAKIGTSKNAQFAERFRAENYDLVQYVDELRQPLLRGLKPYETQQKGLIAAQSLDAKLPSFAGASWRPKAKSKEMADAL